jgi:hypothetical protein
MGLHGLFTEIALTITMKVIDRVGWGEMELQLCSLNNSVLWFMNIGPCLLSGVKNACHTEACPNEKI